LGLGRIVVNKIRRLVNAKVLAIGVLKGCSAADPPALNALETRGHALRKDIDTTHRQFVAAGTSTGMADFGPQIAAPIPPGTTFDDAEAILKYAGFKVEQRPHPDLQVTHGASYEYGHVVLACINPYVQNLFHREMLCAALITEKRFEFKAVKTIRGTITSFGP
jgi:hypothetical protein